MISTDKHNIAILVFANSSKEELRHKPMFHGRLLFDKLNEQTIKTVDKSNLTYFHFSEKQQVGNSFGERFTNAIQAVFDKGYDQIITIGNDAPQLKVSDILVTKKQLLDNKFVLGPTVDGGFYLMGLHKKHFNKAAFLKLHWQASTLAKELLQLVLETKVETFSLKTCIDIDSTKDIKAILSYAFYLPKAFLLILLKICAPRTKLSALVLFSFQNLSLRSHFNKGSPDYAIVVP